MKNNPFATHAPQTPGNEACDGRKHEPAFEAENGSDCEPPSGEFGSGQKLSRFIQLACYAVAIFIVFVFCVVREIEHSRELYRMSRLVSAAEAQKRQWQERHRLDEAREAELLAELLRQQSLPRDPQRIPASHRLPTRRP